MVTVCILSALFIIGTAFFSRIKRFEYEKQFVKERETVLNEWLNSNYSDLSDSTNLEQEIRKIPIRSNFSISDRQKVELQIAIKDGLKAFSEGGESNYIRFRFPKGVAWVWKDEAQNVMSNYFKIGIIYAGAGEFLFYKWLEKYGQPDYIEYYPYWDEWLKERYPTRESLDAHRKEFSDKHGTRPLFYPPKDLFSQWKIMARDMSSDTWYHGLWVKFSPSKSSIVISNYTVPPPFYDRILFEEVVPAQAEGVKSGFANLGIASFGERSLIDWKDSIESLIESNGSVVIADVLVTVLQRVPLLPTRVIVRFVYRNDQQVWVPYDFVVCSKRVSKRVSSWYWIFPA